MHGSWPVESGNTAAGGGGAQYAAAYNEYDPSVYEDDATYSSPEPSDTEEEVVQKKSNIKVKRVSPCCICVRMLFGESDL